MFVICCFKLIYDILVSEACIGDSNRDIVGDSDGWLVLVDDCAVFWCEFWCFEYGVYVLEVVLVDDFWVVEKVDFVVGSPDEFCGYLSVVCFDCEGCVWVGVVDFDVDPGGFLYDDKKGCLFCFFVDGVAVDGANEVGDGCVCVVVDVPEEFWYGVVLCAEEEYGVAVEGD